MNTLKDLEYIGSGIKKVVLMKDLRKEAIKQIITLEMLKLEYGFIRFIKRIQINSQMRWIKYFFNLKKEDLK